MKISIEPFSLAVARAGALTAFFLLGLSLSIRPYLSYPCTYFHLVQLHAALIETAALTATTSVLACLLTDVIIKTETARQR